LHVPAFCPCCISILHIHAAWTNMLHVHPAFPSSLNKKAACHCYMPIMYVGAACPCQFCLSMLHVMCPCCEKF
jgi:hypothetical protein